MEKSIYVKEENSVEREGKKRKEESTGDVKSKNSEISVKLGLGITDTGKNIAVIGIEDENEKTIISMNSNSQLGRMIGIMGLLSVLPGCGSKIKPHIETIKIYSLLPLNFSKYTNDHVYVGVSGDETHNFKEHTYRIISKEFVNKDSILIEANCFEGMTDGGIYNKIDDDDPNVKEWREYGIINFKDFNKLSKVIDEKDLWFHKFDNVTSEREKGKEYENFYFINIMTHEYTSHLCQEDFDFYLKIFMEEMDKNDPLGRSCKAHDIDVEKDIFQYITPVLYKDLFDFDFPPFEFENSLSEDESEESSETDGK